MKRIHYLDGIRGWAAIVVLLSHLIMHLLVYFSPEYNGFLVECICDGHFAVLVFFVLSGYALSIRRVKNNKSDLAVPAAGRYLRLAIPVFITSFIAYIMQSFGLLYTAEIIEAQPALKNIMATFYNFEPSIPFLLKDSFYNSFFFWNMKNYNPNLWTMPYELAGSFFIFGYLAIFVSGKKSNWQAGILLTVILLFMKPYMACFMFGCLIAQLGHALKFKKSKAQEFGLLALFLAFFITPAYLQIQQIHDDIIYTLLAAGLLLVVSHSNLLQAFFSNRLSNFLGRISFPLYLIQIPVICSWSAYVLLWFKDAGISNNIAAHIDFVSTIAICILASAALIPVEDFSVSFSKKFARKFLKSDFKSGKK